MKSHALPLVAALIVVALLFSPSEAGQTYGPGGPPPPPPTPIADAVFGKLLAGEFTGDLDPDAVVLDAGLPTLLVAPEVYQTTVRADGVVNDIASLPASDGGPARLLVVGAGGLQELVWSETLADWQTEDHETVAWAGARRLAIADLDDTGDLDVVALGDDVLDPKSILVMHGDGLGGFTPGVGFSTLAPAYDLLVLDWDGDGMDEIAALTDYGVEVYDAAGEYVADIAYSVSTILGTVVREPGIERLAMIAWGATGPNQWLLLFDRNGMEGPTGLGAQGAVRMISGDVDGDLDDDLFLTLDSDTAFVELTYFQDNEQGDPGDPTFDLVGGLATVPFGNPSRDPSTNAAGLAIADFDHDGDADVLAPAQGDYVSGPGTNKIFSEVVLLRNGDVDESLWMPTLVESNLYLQEGPDLEILLQGPATTLDVQEGELVKLAFTLWHGPDVYEPTATTPYLATQLIELPASTEQASIASVISGTGLYPWPDIYSYELRQVVVDGTDQILRHGPAVTAIWGSDANYETLQQYPNISNLIITIPVNPGGSSWPGGGVVVGPHVPSYDDDSAPR